MKKVLFTATVDSHILHFHIPYLKLFKENGYEVHVATNGDEEIPYCDVKHKISFERSPFKINNVKAIKNLKKLIDKEQFEIIHCHTPMGSVVTRIAAMKARKNGTRVIYTAHGFHFYKGAPILNWLLFYPVEKWLSKFTDTLITINKEDYELAKRKFKKCRDIEYVHGVGIDEEKFNFELSNEEKHDLRESLGINDNDFVIIYVAELIKRKNQSMAIKTMKELVPEHSNIKLLLVGKDSYNGTYQKLVKKLNLEKNVIFAGYRKDVPKLMKMSDLAISTAKQEGLPINIIEAMACGLPVIATDCRGNRDLVDNLIDIDNIIELKNSIESFIKKKIYNLKNISKYTLKSLLTNYKKIYAKCSNKKVLIMPTCTDLNRGDQALVIVTSDIIRKKYSENSEIYMMTDGETSQCEKFGLKTFSDILKHPSRIAKNKKENISYSLLTKIIWGSIALCDLFSSLLLLNKFTRRIVKVFLSEEKKKSIKLYEESTACFVKGGGFIHDFSGGLIGIYTMYYQIFHIRLALAMKKPVYIMPNSFGPFKSNINKKMVNKILNKCKIVTARESISASAQRNGLERNIELYPDLAFFLSDNNRLNEEQKKNIKSKYFLENKKYVAITVRPYRFYQYDNPNQKYEEYKKVFVNFVKYLKEKEYIPIFVVHTRAINSHENDELCIKEITDMIDDKQSFSIIKDDNLNCYDIKEIYNNCNYVIGTRFHSVIFSISQNIPAIAITYGGNKGDGIMHDMLLDEYAIKIGELNLNTLINKFEKLEKNKTDVLDKINNYLDSSRLKYNELISEINNK